MRAEWVPNNPLSLLFSSLVKTFLAPVAFAINSGVGAAFLPTSSCFYILWTFLLSSISWSAVYFSGEPNIPLLGLVFWLGDDPKILLGKKRARYPVLSALSVSIVLSSSKLPFAISATYSFLEGIWIFVIPFACKFLMAASLDPIRLLPWAYKGWPGRGFVGINTHTSSCKTSTSASLKILST